MITLVHIRYTLFTVVLCLTFPQNRYSFPVKPPGVRVYEIHQDNNVSKTVRSQPTSAVSTHLNNDSKISRPTVGVDPLNASGISKFMNPRHMVPDIFQNVIAKKRTADLVVQSPSLTRLGAFNVPNFRSTWVDRYLQRISIITGKLVNLLPFGTVSLHNLERHELGIDLTTHSSSVRNRNSSNWKSVSTEEIASKNRARLRRLRLLAKNQGDWRSNHSKNSGFLGAISWPSIPAFKGSVRLDPPQAHAVAQSIRKITRTPNSRPKGRKGKYRKDPLPTLKRYQNSDRLTSLPHDSLDHNYDAETVQLQSRHSEGSETEAARHRNLTDSHRSRSAEEQIQDERSKSDPMVSPELPEKEFEMFSNWQRAADFSRIGLSKMVQLDSSVSKEGDPGLLPHTIDGQLHTMGNFTKLSQVVYKVVKAKRAKAMVAAPCQSAAAWFPNVLKRLEKEMSDLQFYCIYTGGSETESENLKKAFNGISSLRFGGFLLANPDDIEIVMPKNMDMVITWFEVQQWGGIRRALRFLTGLRRSGVRTILVTTACNSVSDERKGNEMSAASTVTTFRSRATKEKPDECNRLVVYSPNG